MIMRSKATSKTVSLITLLGSSYFEGKEIHQDGNTADKVKIYSVNDYTEEPEQPIQEAPPEVIEEQPDGDPTEIIAQIEEIQAPEPIEGQMETIEQADPPAEEQPEPIQETAPEEKPISYTITDFYGQHQGAGTINPDGTTTKEQPTPPETKPEQPIQNIEIDKKELETILKKAVQFIPTRSNMIPILNNVLIEQHPEGLEGSLRITATDMETTYQDILTIQKYEGPGDLEAKTITINAKALLDLVKIQKTKNISLAINQEIGYITVNGIKLVGLYPEEYPRIEKPGIEINKYFIEAIQLEDLINNVKPGLAPKGESNIAFNCMLLETNSNEITAVTTDGQRLVISKTWIKQDSGPASQILIPEAAAKKLLKLIKGSKDTYYLMTTRRELSELDEKCYKKEIEEARDRHYKNQKEKPENERTRYIEPTRKADNLYLTTGTQSFACRIIDGQFPEYKRVIPENPKYKYTYNKITLIEALEAIQSTRNKQDTARACALTMHPFDTIIESHRDTEQEPHITNTIPSSNERGEGTQEISLIFDIKKLIEGIQQAPGTEILIQTNGQYHPVIITDQDATERYKYILVSLRPK